MAFYILSQSKIFEHQFDYLKLKSGRRLEPTLVPSRSTQAETRAEAYAIEVMSKKLHTLSPSSSVDEALKTMQENDIHHLPVVNHDKILGIVSDRDLLKLKDRSSLLKAQLGLEWFMSKIIILCHEETPIDHIAKVFCHEHINGILVIDDAKSLTGIVTHHDLLRWIYDGPRN